MKKNILMLFIAAITITAACTKSTDPAPENPSGTDPKKGSQWTYKMTTYDQSGTSTGSTNVSFVGDTMTISGSSWIILKETSSMLPKIGIQKRADGWWWVPFPNTNASLWFKTPAAVGDKYNYNISDLTVDTAKVTSINSSVTVPAGAFSNLTFMEGFDTNSKEDEYYFTATGAILVRQGTFDDRTPGPGMYEKQRMELVSFTR
jgi:hypothetical protein